MLFFGPKSEITWRKIGKCERGNKQPHRNASNNNKKKTKLLQIQCIRRRSSSRRIRHDVYCSYESSIIINHYIHSHGWESFFCVWSTSHWLPLFCFFFLSLSLSRFISFTPHSLPHIQIYSLWLRIDIFSVRYYGAAEKTHTKEGKKTLSHTSSWSACVRLLLYVNEMRWDEFTPVTLLKTICFVVELPGILSVERNDALNLNIVVVPLPLLCTYTYLSAKERIKNRDARFHCTDESSTHTHTPHTYKRNRKDCKWTIEVELVQVKRIIFIQFTTRRYCLRVCVCVCVWASCFLEREKKIDMQMRAKEKMCVQSKSGREKGREKKPRAIEVLLNAFIKRP